MRACCFDKQPRCAPPRVAGELLRVHPHPKRFPACAATHWPSTLLHVDTDYVVLNKPAGVPCMSHESNALEHLQVAASAALCLGQLEVCHRSGFL